MLIHKGYKFRCFPTEEQETMIRKTIGCVRFVFNYALGKQRQEENYWKTTEHLFQSGMLPSNEWKGSFFHAAKAQRDLTALKKNHEWLKEPDSTSLQFTLQELGKAYGSYYQDLKTGKPVHKRKGKPKFKSKKNEIQSFTSKCNRTKTGPTIRVEQRKNKWYVLLPKIGWMLFAKSKDIKGRILKATVRYTPSGKFFVSFATEQEQESTQESMFSTGIDVGLKDFATFSDGHKIANPKWFRRAEEKLAKAQQILARRQKGSANWEKQRIKVAKLYEKITNQRNDFLHKLSTSLVNENQVIGIEDLRVKNMVKNKNLSKVIHEASWSEFRHMLEYKAKWQGKEVIVVGSNFPSSQLCSNCKEKNPAVKNLKIRTWLCPHCHAEHDRDLNAAINILEEALKIYAAGQTA